MRKEFEEILSKLVGEPVEMDFEGSFEKNGVDNGIILGMMLCKRLEDINNTLSDISTSLDGIEQSLNSVVAVNGNNSFLCVTGNITSY